MTIFTKCDQVLSSGRNAALATIVEASTGTPGKQGFKLLLADDGELFGTVGGGALENRAIEEARGVLTEGRSRIFHFDLNDLGMECGGKVDMIIEYLPAVAPFVLFGGGHVARALCPILQSIGYAVSVFDPRPETAGHFGEMGARVVPGEYADLSKHKNDIQNAKYCVIATHGHQHDFHVLKQLLEFDENFCYIGLIGSKRKVRVTLGRLGDEGITVPSFVYSPIGLKIGALTAAEIAVAIAAEVVAVKNGTAADHMRAIDGSSSAEK
jgi:xanthine dehydrogenase accessory factor